MQQTDERSACSAASFDRSLISSDALSQWKGLPIAWIESSPHAVEADLAPERNGLVMIDTGATRADLRYGTRSTSWEFTPGSIGFFARGTELKRSRWNWTQTRRIYLDLGAGRPGDENFLGWPSQLPDKTELEFRDPELACLLRMLANEAAAGNPHGQLFAESLCLGAAFRLQQRAKARFGATERGKLTAAQMAAVEDAIRSHQGHNVSLRLLSEAAGFSAPQFLRLFKNTMGCSPHQYVLRTRLERARRLVTASELSLAVIAHETGFASQSHMTAAFVRAFKAAPGEMRRVAGRGKPGSMVS